MNAGRWAAGVKILECCAGHPRRSVLDDQDNNILATATIHELWG
jgi:hypothetical protein